MKGLAAFTAVARREIAGICANPALVFFCFWTPVLWLLVVWGLLGQGIVQKVPVAIIDNDRTPLSRETARAISAARSVALETFLSPDEALGAMRRGSVYGVLLIPAGYERDSESGRGSSVVFWVDENRYAVAGSILPGVSGALESLGREKMRKLAFKSGYAPDAAQRLVSLVHSDFYAPGNIQNSFLAFLGSTLMPGLVMIAAMLGFTTAFLRELWHSSVAAWMETARGSLAAAVFGKLAPYYVLYALIFLFISRSFPARAPLAGPGRRLCGLRWGSGVWRISRPFRSLWPRWRPPGGSRSW